MEDVEIYKQALEEMPGGFFIYHADGEEELIHANRALLRMFGCSTMEEFKDLTGFTFKGMVHPDDLEAAEKSIWDQINDSSYSLDYLEYRIIRKDGTIRWVEDYGHYVVTEQYGPVFYVFVDDATDRMNERTKRLEEANRKLKLANEKEKQYWSAILKDSLAFFEVNISKDLILTPVKQVSSDSKDSYDFMNRTSASITSYSELIQYFAGQCSPEDEKAYLSFFHADRLMRCYEKGEREQKYEVWISDMMGRKRLIRYTFLLAQNEESRELLGIVLIKDITNLADGKALLEIAFEQAKNARAERDNFLSKVSYDLKNPLNAIDKYLDTLTSIPDDEGSYEKIMQNLGKIQLFSKQLQNAVDGFLEFSKMENAKAALSEKAGSIQEMLKGIEKQVLVMAEAKGLYFHIEQPDVIHDTVIADFERLSNILYKLLDNSIKFTKEGGLVVLSVKEDKKNLNGYAKYHFKIEDNGIGMDKELIERVFEPFERGQHILEDGVIGSGFGLAVVKGLVDMMEGNIKVESRPGYGSTFIVTVLFRLMEEDA